MTAYYNEFDPFAAAWLRELIKAGHIAPGEVDERSIIDVKPDDLRGFTQHHFFAGIGIWSYALRQAGWPDDRHVWTGSPPCQPFSTAGKQKGKEDERHLAPHWLDLVSECHPPVVFGEQVQAAIRHEWLDDLQAHLEAENYSCGAIVLPACGIGAPHIRQRLWFVAERLENSTKQGLERAAGASIQRTESRSAIREKDGGVDNTKSEGLEGHTGDGHGIDKCRRQQAEQDRSVTEAGSTGRLAHSEVLRGGEGFTDASRSGERSQEEQRAITISNDKGELCRLANSAARRQDTGSASSNETENGRTGRNEQQQDGDHGYSGDGEDSGTGQTNDFWRAPDWLYCRDGKWRPVESGTFPLVDGAAARVGRLRGYGNGIVAPLAQAFIETYMEININSTQKVEK